VSRHHGKTAALRQLRRDSGTGFEAEISTGPLSMYERQRILSMTSFGVPAGRLPVGHHDDSTGRFTSGLEPGEEPRVIQFHPDEEAAPEELAALQVTERWRPVAEMLRSLLRFWHGLVHERDAELHPDFRERLGDVDEVTAHGLAGLELGASTRQVRRRIESANRKLAAQAVRASRALYEGADDDAPGDQHDEE